MADYDGKKTILLEKQYLYVKASKGFQLVGTSTEVVPTNIGYYRFLVDNVTHAIGNSYVDVLYFLDDSDFQAYCSDLFLENVQDMTTLGLETVNETLKDMNTGLSGALQTVVTNQSSLLSSQELIRDLSQSMNSKLAGFDKPIELIRRYSSLCSDYAVYSKLYRNFLPFIYNMFVLYNPGSDSMDIGYCNRLFNNSLIKSDINFVEDSSNKNLYIADNLSFLFECSYFKTSITNMCNILPSLEVGSYYVFRLGIDNPYNIDISELCCFVLCPKLHSYFYGYLYYGSSGSSKIYIDFPVVANSDTSLEFLFYFGYMNSAQTYSYFFSLSRCFNLLYSLNGGVFGDIYHGYDMFKPFFTSIN